MVLYVPKAAIGENEEIDLGQQLLLARGCSVRIPPYIISNPSTLTTYVCTAYQKKRGLSLPYDDLKASLKNAMAATRATDFWMC